MLGDSASELIDQFGTETFKAVHDSDQDGLIYFAGNGTIEYANRAALELFGVGPEMIGENIFELDERDYEGFSVEPIVPSDHFEKARETFETGVPNRSEMVLVEGDDRREIEVVWGPVEDDGEVTGVVGSYRDVSPRPDIHDQLSFEASRLDEERRFLASIIDVLDDGILVFDGDATLQLANPAALELLGLDPPVEGIELGDLLERSTLCSPEQFSSQLRRTASSDAETNRAQVAVVDGERRRLEIEMTPATYGRNRLVCTLTPRDGAAPPREIELFSRIARLGRETATAAEIADRAVTAIDEELAVDFAVLTRLKSGRLEPLAWRGVMLDAEMRLALETEPRLERLLEEGEPGELDDWPWGEDRNDETFEHAVVPLPGPDGPLGTLHIGQAKELDRALVRFAETGPEPPFLQTLADVLGSALGGAFNREQTELEQHRLRRLVETLPVGVLLYTRRGDVVLYNSRFADMTGYDDWDDLNTDSRPFRILDADGETVPRSEWPFFRSVREASRCRESFTLEFGHETRDILIDTAPLADSAGSEPELFVGTIRDVTEQRKLNRRKDEFLSIASHELRSPLTPLTGVLQLARRQRERGDDVDLSLLTRAERQVSRLTRLIDGLLDLTRIENDRIELEPRELEVGAFIEDSMQPWRLHPKGVEIEMSVPEHPVRAELDPDRINQVLSNVVDNAIKYSKANEVVRIEVSDADSRVRIAVEDDGVGMDEETVDRIFDRFYHGGDAGSGSRSMGLGLYICRQIIEQHRGEICVESEQGDGTRVEIELPKDWTDGTIAN